MYTQLKLEELKKVMKKYVNKYFNMFLLRHAHGREGKTRICLKHVAAPERR